MTLISLPITENNIGPNWQSPAPAPVSQRSRVRIPYKPDFFPGFLFATANVAPLTAMNFLHITGTIVALLLFFQVWVLFKISVFSILEFGYCICRSIRCLHLHCYSQKLTPAPLPLYPMNFLHCSSSRNYFRYFGSLFLFLLNRLANFCF